MKIVKTFFNLISGQNLKMLLSVFILEVKSNDESGVNPKCSDFCLYLRLAAGHPQYLWPQNFPRTQPAFNPNIISKNYD